MKTIKIKAEITNNKDMNELVDKICEITNQDRIHLRDRFKMVTQANSKTLNDLCKFLKLILVFDYSGEKNTACVEVNVNSHFKTNMLDGKNVDLKINSIPESSKDSLFESVKDNDGNGLEDEDEPF